MSCLSIAIFVALTVNTLILALGLYLARERVVDLLWAWKEAAKYIWSAR